jgi:protocatechuate 3,4-dioxygenase beta subunit
LDSTDLSDVTILMTDRPVELSGTVLDERGRPVVDATVYVFGVSSAARERLAWAPSRLAWTRSSDAGAYRILGLLPGEYFVAAVAPGNLQDITTPEVTAALERVATKVRLDDGERRVLDVKLDVKR